MNGAFMHREWHNLRRSMAQHADELLKINMDLNSLYTGDENKVNNDLFAIEHSGRWKVIEELDEIILSSSK